MLGYYAVMSNFSQQTTRLLDQVCNVLRLEHYSYRTEEAYVQWIKRFIVFNVRLGDNMKKLCTSGSMACLSLPAGRRGQTEMFLKINA